LRDHFFSIQFQGVNNAGFGEYPDGFNPTCAAADDLAHALGDPQEGLLNLALGFRARGSCVPLVSAGAPTRALNLAGMAAAGPTLSRNPFRENRILRGR
jgi:carboxyl-terminal processing protease